MKIENCPLCEKIKSEKLKLYMSISSENIPPLCKDHFYELLKVKNISVNFEKYGKENCLVCSLERRIEDELFNDFREYYKLCLYHISKIKDKLREDDLKEIINKLISFKEYLEELIDSYDYRREKFSSTDFYLILDHLLGTGRRI